MYLPDIMPAPVCAEAGEKNFLLKNPMEIHRRAWVIPLIGIMVTLLIAFVVMVLYFEFYMIVTPKQCIAPGQWREIWR